MSISSRRHGRLMGAAVAGMALLLVPAGFSSAQAAVDPAPISGLRVVTEPVTPAGDLTVEWDASPSDNVSEQMVEVNDYQGPDFIDYIGADETEYTVNNLNPGQAVRITITALSADENDEGYSKPVSIVANTLGDVNEDGTFFDTNGNTFEYEIAWLATTGITTGYDDGTYRPTGVVLREQMAAFIFRLIGEDNYEAPQYSKFEDVPTTHTFYREISWMYDHGISTGYSNGDGTRSFAPQAPVLREQMAAFLYRAGYGFGGGFLYSHGSDPASFSDVPSSHPFFDEIEFMALANITTGYADGTFRPGQPVLREQMAAFLYRTVGAIYSDAFGSFLIEGEQFTMADPAAVPAAE